MAKPIVLYDKDGNVLGEFKTIKEALAAMTPGDELKIAEGTYE